MIEAANELESLKIYGENLNVILKCYSGRLESLREKIEGAARLHHLLALKLNEADVQMEMQKLAEKIGLSCLMKNYHHGSKANSNGHNHLSSSSFKKVTGKMTITTTTITTSTPKKEISCDSNQPLSSDSHTTIAASNSSSSSVLPAIEESPEKKLESHTTIAKACQEEDIDDIDEEEDNMTTTTATTLSKTHGNDSGLGVSATMSHDESFASEMKEEEKLMRGCSCESLVDDATMNACDADLDDYDTSENITSISMDEASKSESINNMAPVPLQANAHLYCHASNLQLDLDDSIIDQKTQK